MKMGESTYFSLPPPPTTGLQQSGCCHLVETTTRSATVAAGSRGSTRSFLAIRSRPQGLAAGETFLPDLASRRAFMGVIVIVCFLSRLSGRCRRLGIEAMGRCRLALDSTVIVPALPQMARSFGASPVGLNIGVTVYTLTLAVVIPIGGWMADRFGARRVFATAIASRRLCFPDLRPRIAGPGADAVGGDDGVRIGAGLLLGALALRHFRSAEQPLIALGALRVPTYAMTLRGGSLFRVSVTMAPFLLPTMFQLGFGLNPFASGLLILPLFAGSVGMKIVTTRLLRRYGFRRVLLVNGTLTTLTIVGCAALTPSTPYTVISIVLFASGLTRFLQFSALNSLTFADVPPDQMSAANTLANVVQQLTLGFGVAAAAAAVHLAAPLNGDVATGPTLTDFRTAIAAAAIMAAASTLDALALSSDAGSLVSGHRPLRSERENDLANSKA